MCEVRCTYTWSFYHPTTGEGATHSLFIIIIISRPPSSFAPSALRQQTRLLFQHPAMMTWCRLLTPARISICRSTESRGDSHPCHGRRHHRHLHPACSSSFSTTTTTTIVSHIHPSPSSSRLLAPRRSRVAGVAVETLECVSDELCCCLSVFLLCVPRISLLDCDNLTALPPLILFFCPTPPFLGSSVCVCVCLC